VPLLHLSVHGFRNLRPQDLDVPTGTVVVVGPNGAGKTSLLEAVAVLGNLQSFRPGPAASWVQHGGQGFVLGGLVERGGTTVELRQEGRLARTVSRRLQRGARRLGAAEYLDLFPVSVLSSHDRQLLWGRPEGGGGSSTASLYLHPDAAVLQRYRRVLRQQRPPGRAGSRRRTRSVRARPRAARVTW
jgi:DNA replication and repair protein RecF